MWIPLLLVAGVLLFLFAPYFVAKFKKGKPVLSELGTPPGYTGLIYFSGKNCSHCRVMDPHVREAESNGIPIMRFSTDENPSVAIKAGVMSIPTLLVIRNGVVENQVIGVQTVEKMQEFIS